MILERNKETRFKGLPISPGVVVARVCLFRQNRHNELPAYEVSQEGPDRERQRLKQALQTVTGRLEGLRKTVAERIGEAEAEIFVAQKMILDDPVLGGQMDEILAGGSNAETAVFQSLDAYESQLLKIDDAYLKERASDLGELKRRLLDVLCETRPSFQCESNPNCRRGSDRIVITEELTPTATLEMATDRLLGFVTAHGGPTSHAAILARALGIPAVSGIPGIHDLVPCGTEVLLDGYTGEVVVFPAEDTKALALGRAGAAEAAAPAEPVESLQVLANISLASEVDEAMAMKAEGVGLYRTEFEFFAANRLLSEDEQLERYARVVEAMSGRCVYFRLLDVGADKASPVFELPEEDNPSLGCRGARLLLARPDLLRDQARALVRASRVGPVHVMYPMIADPEQFGRLRRLFNEATADLSGGDVYHGVMFEVPSACLAADELLEAADFASIGSNDLVQYLFAVDRNNERVAYDYRADREVFWRLLGDMVAAAGRAGKPLSICGELAADVACTAKLLEIGIRTVSVSARCIPTVRRAAAEVAAEAAAERR